jgi:hypothetical protein
VEEIKFVPNVSALKAARHVGKYHDIQYGFFKLLSGVPLAYMDFQTVFQTLLFEEPTNSEITFDSLRTDGD